MIFITLAKVKNNISKNFDEISTNNRTNPSKIVENKFR